MSGLATVIPGEASETDDDDENGNIANGSSQQAAAQNNEQTRSWNLKEAQQRSWSSHVDEKVEERWRSLGYDTMKVAERQAVMQRKQLENLKQNIANTQHAVQTISSIFRQVAENLGRVESNLSLLQEGAKLIPDFSSQSLSNSSSSKE